MFRVGQKVVRIGSSPDAERMLALLTERYGHFSHPAIGEVCTVATINEWTHWTLFTFREHDNSHLIAKIGCKYEPGFDAKHFRPVVARKTDISIFTKILTDNKIPALTRARKAAQAS